jgi:transcriptional regulator with XRE-family HTH domain
MTFGERLVYAREKMGMTQAEVSQRSGIYETSICKFEKGEREPSLHNIRQLCLALKVSADYLLDINLKKLWGMPFDCAGAGMTGDGKCMSYQVSETNSEPHENCRGCPNSQFYEEGVENELGTVG